MRTQNADTVDDLALIWRMVYDTKDNVDHHISVVGSIWENLDAIHKDSKHFEEVLKSGNINQL